MMLRRNRCSIPQMLRESCVSGWSVCKVRMGTHAEWKEKGTRRHRRTTVTLKLEVSTRAEVLKVWSANQQLPCHLGTC